jgi:biopolymer transport protein TolR
MSEAVAGTGSSGPRFADMSGAPGPRSEINVTPLVDVVLVLLIIFMVVTPLLQMGYDVTVPPKSESATPPPPQQDQVVVSVTGDKRIFLNKENVPVAQLPVRLSTVLKNRTKSTVFFSADDRLGYGDAVGVLDTIRNSGAKNIAIIEEWIDPSLAPAEGAAPAPQ